MPRIRFAGRSVVLPRNRIVRIGFGSALTVLGLFGFLPVLGFWMVPLGLAVLSVDFAIARRARRRSEVALARRWRAWREARRGARPDQPSPRPRPERAQDE